METNAPDRNPEVSAQPYLEGDGDAVPWATAVAELAEADTYWLATLHPAGRPHVVPVLAVWVDGVPHVAAAPASRKARNLARVPAVTLTTTGDRWDHVIEGTARPVAAGDLLRRIAGAYLARYGCPWRSAAGPSTARAHRPRVRARTRSTPSPRGVRSGSRGTGAASPPGGRSAESHPDGR